LVSGARSGFWLISEKKKTCALAVQHKKSGLWSVSDERSGLGWSAEKTCTLADLKRTSVEVRRLVDQPPEARDGLATPDPPSESWPKKRCCVILAFLTAIHSFASRSNPPVNAYNF
jgi:hypothetical protein